MDWLIYFSYSLHRSLKRHYMIKTAIYWGLWVLFGSYIILSKSESFDCYYIFKFNFNSSRWNRWLGRNYRLHVRNQLAVIIFGMGFCILQTSLSRSAKAGKRTFTLLFTCFDWAVFHGSDYAYFIVTAYYSSGGTFIKQYFKPSVLNFFEVESISVRVNVLIFDILNETFNIFSRSYELSGVENTDCPTWYNQFLLTNCFRSFAKCMKLNILKYAEFLCNFMVRGFQKKYRTELLQKRLKLDDYRSALCVSSNENTFGMERSFIILWQTNKIR